jgi:hypothetical protein
MNYRKNGMIFGFIISQLALSASVFAGPANSAPDTIAELIHETQSQNQIQIIVPVAQSPNDNYNLTLISDSTFAKQLELTGLSTPATLDNAYFQIVDDETSASLPVGDFDGDNVLYHLMEARTYYAKLARGSGFPDAALEHKIVVRVRVDHGYNLVTHFAQWNDYNNSRYIPASFQGDSAAHWSQEIWFDSRKSQLSGVDWYSVAVSSGLAVALQNWVALSATPLELLGQYNAGIDAAKQPGVIYHEAFHYSTDATGLFPMASEGNPVAEDYANYFGASILGRAQIADLMEYSGRYYKRDYSKIIEVDDTSPLTYNAVPFGPSIFWNIREQLGQARADQLIWNSLKYLNGSSLATDEPKAISAAAQEDASLTTDEVAQINALLEKYHQSYVNLELKFNPGETQLIDDNTIESSASKVGGDSTQLRKEAAKPGFKGRVVAVLNWIAHGILSGSEDAAKAIGYVGSTVFAVGNAPVDFGTDLLSGLVLGHGMVTTNDQSLPDEMIGAAGGVTAAYYTYVGLDALGYSIADPAISISVAAVMADTLICNGADAKGPTSLDHYCATNTKILSTVDGDAAKAGATIGDVIHDEIEKIGEFFTHASSAKQD